MAITIPKNTLACPLLSQVLVASTCSISNEFDGEPGAALVKASGCSWLDVVGRAGGWRECSQQVVFLVVVVIDPCPLFTALMHTLLEQHARSSVYLHLSYVCVCVC